MSAAIVTAPRPRFTVGTMAGLVFAAATTELVLLRLGTRTVIHIPGVDTLSGVLGAAAESGRLAYYTAVVLLVLLAGMLLRDGEWPTRLGVVVLLVAAGLARAGLLSSLPLALALMVSMMLVLLPVRGRLLRWYPLLMFAAAFAVSVVAQIQTASDSTTPMLAELMVVAAGVSAPLSLGAHRRDRPATWTAITVGVVLTAALVANPWTVKILLLWNFGIAGYLPGAVYGLAAALLAYTVVAAVRRRTHHLAWGLGLLLVGGLGLLSTYQSALMVTGLAVTAGFLRASSTEAPAEHVTSQPSGGIPRGVVAREPIRNQSEGVPATTEGKVRR